MKVNEVLPKIKELGYPSRWYAYREGNGMSIDDACKCMLVKRKLLFRKKYKWEIYFLDERGNKNEFKSFTTEDDACDYFLQWLTENKEFNDKHGLWPIEKK